MLAGFDGVNVVGTSGSDGSGGGSIVSDVVVAGMTGVVTGGSVVCGGGDAGG